MFSTSYLNEEIFYHQPVVQTVHKSNNGYNELVNVVEVSSGNGEIQNECIVPGDSQPYIEVIIQPAEKFRFRYGSELGSHGKLRGRLTDKPKSKLNFPTVKLQNVELFDDITIKASLCTYEDVPRPHILELVGKNCMNGECSEALSDGNTAIFRSLEIDNKTKEEAITKIMAKKSCLSGRRCSKNQTRKEAMEEFKLLNMNCVVLCFQAFQGQNPICDKVFSAPIRNSKSTTSDLKIVRISRCSGSCSGGDDIILLCDKINKDNIEIHFYIKNENDDVLWLDKGCFNPKSDVHHQVAIAFQTPPFKDNVGGLVQVELYRRTDEQRSEPRPFEYIPNEEAVLRNTKKRKLSLLEPIVNQPSCSSSSSDDPDSLFDLISNPDIFTSELGILKELSSNGSPWSSEYFDDLMKGSLVDGDSFEEQLARALPGSDILSIRNENSVEMDAININFTDMNYLVPSDKSTKSRLKERIMNVPYSVNLTVDDKRNTSESTEVNDDPKSQVMHLSSINNIKNLSTQADNQKYSDNSDIKLKAFPLTENIIRGNLGEIRGESNDVGFIVKKSVDHLKPESNTAMSNSHGFKDFKDSVSHVLGKCTSDVYLRFISRLVSVPDNSGNLFFHLAVLEQPHNLNFIAKFARLFPKCINAPNMFKETTLHLATQINAPRVILPLIANGGNPNIQDVNGNTCFHIASKQNYTECLKILLLPGKMYRECIMLIDEINYDGYAPVHLAVINNAEECLKLLLQAGANVNTQDKQSGSTPLHLALKQHPSLVGDILCQPEVDLLKADFNGDTIIHLLCQLKGVPMPNMEDLSSLHGWVQRTLAIPTTSIFDESSSSESSCSSDYSDEEDDSETLAGSNAGDDCLSEECVIRLRNHLDVSAAWKKLGLFIGLDETTLKYLALLRMNHSPSQYILKKIEDLYQAKDKHSLINILKEADLEEAARILKE